MIQDIYIVIRDECLYRKQPKNEKNLYLSSYEKEEVRKTVSFCFPKNLYKFSFFFPHKREGKRQRGEGMRKFLFLWPFDPPCLDLFGLFGPMRRRLVLEVCLEAVFEIGVHRRGQRMEWQKLGDPTAELYQGMFKRMMGRWGGISVNETIQDGGNTSYELMVFHGRGQKRASFSSTNASIRSNLNLFRREAGHRG